MNVEQDGADFYDADNHSLIERIEAPFLKRYNPSLPGDHWYSLDAAEESRAEFIKKHPETIFIDN